MTEESRNAIYHRCRWCRYFHNGYCSKLSDEFGNPTAKIYADIDYAMGDGVLTEPIQTVLEDMRSNFSNELQENDTKWQNLLEVIVEDLEFAVRNAILSDEASNGFEFKDQNTDFYCKYFE